MPKAAYRTDKRKLILGALVVRHRLAQSQVYALLEAKTDAERRGARRLMLKMYQAGLISRESRLLNKDLLERIVHWEFTYSLSAKGLTVGQALGLDSGGFGRVPETRSQDKLRHEIVLSELQTAFAAADRALIWGQQSERTARHRFIVPAGSFVVIPDVVLRFHGYWATMELELSKHGHYRKGESQKHRKFRNYFHYSKRPECPWLERWPKAKSGMFKLFIEMDASRRDRILDWVHKKYPYAYFLVAALDDVLTNPAGEIWYSAKNKQATTIMQRSGA